MCAATKGIRSRTAPPSNHNKGRPPSGEGRVMPAEMNHRGFEDCDWISHEINWQFWLSLPRPLELHVPCRDISEHLLSIANHQNLQFECQADGKSEFNRVIAGFNFDRYDDKLVNTEGIEAYCLIRTTMFPTWYPFTAKAEINRICSPAHQ